MEQTTERAFDKIEELIAESRTPNSHGLFAFDEQIHEIAFNARPRAESPVLVYHRLRKPTSVELNDRESRIKYETVEVSSREDEIRVDDEAANIWLWNKIILAVKGYNGVDGWQELAEEQKTILNPNHKVIAIRAFYAGSCEVESDSDIVSIGPETWTVVQKIGADEDKPDFTVRHILREPTEAERVKFKRSASSTAYVRGAKKTQVRVTTRLRPYAELYDALMQDIDGATVNGESFIATNRAQFLAAIDPIWKRQVIQCLMSYIEAQLLD